MVRYHYGTILHHITSQQIDRLASASHHDSTAWLCDGNLTTEAHIAAPLDIGHSEQIKPVTFSVGGSRLATVPSLGTVWFGDRNTGISTPVPGDSFFRNIPKLTY